MATFATVKINHRNLGAVSVKIDKEDKHLLGESTMICKAGGNRYYVRYSDGAREYLHRAIFEEHGILSLPKMRPNNGNHFDLRKRNWI